MGLLLAQAERHAFIAGSLEKIGKVLPRSTLTKDPFLPIKESKDSPRIHFWQKIEWILVGDAFRKGRALQ